MTLNVNDDENFFNKEISLQNDKCDDIDHCLSVSMDVAENWKLCVSVGFFFVGPMHYSRDPQIQISANFSLKLGPTALFTYLKIILLQYFQFSVISSIQTNP